MREVLFRVRDNGRWYYGLPLHISKTNVQFEGVDENGEKVNSLLNEKDTLGQFTGKTDKNGKKIFEGDIVEYQFDEIGKQRAIVYWNVAYAGFLLNPLANFQFTKLEDGEVIGNIYDNPELLEGQ